MVKKVTWLVVSCLMALSLVMASCGTAVEEEEEKEEIAEEEEEEEIAEEEKEEKVTDSEVPQYGGTLTLRLASDPVAFDPYFGSRWEIQTMSMDSLARRDPTLDPAVHKIKYVPIQYDKGLLAESWELPDLQTMIIHIRKGVHYQDKYPSNGREFTAYDVEFHYHRMYGLGSGYTERTTHTGLGLVLMGLESVTATDKYTVVFKVSQPSMLFAWELLEPLSVFCSIVPMDAVKLYGDVNDWRNQQGTGPYFLDDYTTGSAFTFTRNPNYFDHDDFYPENQLPYADTVKILIISDLSTAMAALRTGKIDLLENLDWEQAANLQQMNPELLQETNPGSGFGLGMRVEKEPFTDIRVRRAIQKAIDTEEIAEFYYGGTVPGRSIGFIAEAIEDCYMPYDDWEPEVKEWYAYDPEEAKRLLAEAGYPDGFNTNIVTHGGIDNNLIEVLHAYLEEIGINMEIRVMDTGSFRSFTRAAQHDAFCPFWGNAIIHPSFITMWCTAGNPFNIYGIDDPYFEELCAKQRAATTYDEFTKLTRELDYYVIKQQWTATVVKTTIYHAYQPWLKNYEGWTNLRATEFARFWVDQDLKKSMGH